MRRQGSSRECRVAVAQRGGDFQFDHAAFAHQLHAFGPTFDHSIQRERDRLLRS